MTAPIFILAGEASGDQLAAHLMRAVNNAYDKPDWIGVGGRLMQAEGLESWNWYVDTDETGTFDEDDIVNRDDIEEALDWESVKSEALNIY